ncbi:30S ribosomal protein S17 [Zavarzinella formosa]|uniref:30S ribosomal protein S17 n=1 Tax=Zavarzinella formosa TaxID=360055 RepID=UPI0003124A54|nr:30S ribosomal protein S17 [Zavarzinella formosa]
MADATPNTPAKEANTPRQRTLTGVVTRDSNAKTRRVDVQRLVKHPRYGKYLRERTICYVHDEANVSGMGDIVEIVESRPLSKTKRWTLKSVVRKAPAKVAVAEVPKV